MAEAHQAVSYSNLVKHDHHTENHDREYLQFIRKVKSKSWEKRLDQISRRLRNFIYPAHVESLWIICSVVICLHYAAKKVPYDLVDVVVGLLPTFSSSLALHITACLIMGFFVWITVCLTMKLTLKILLSYRGFMFESRGKSVSLRTKIWGFMLRSRWT